MASPSGRAGWSGSCSVPSTATTPSSRNPRCSIQTGTRTITPYCCKANYMYIDSICRQVDVYMYMCIAMLRNISYLTHSNKNYVQEFIKVYLLIACNQFCLMNKHSCFLLFVNTYILKKKNKNYNFCSCKFSQNDIRNYYVWTINNGEQLSRMFLNRNNTTLLVQSS